MYRKSKVGLSPLGIIMHVVSLAARSSHPDRNEPKTNVALQFCDYLVKLHVNHSSRTWKVSKILQRTLSAEVEEFNLTQKLIRHLLGSRRLVLQQCITRLFGRATDDMN